MRKTLPLQAKIRKDAGVADRDGLENRCTGNRTEGSNPSLSAENIYAASSDSGFFYAGLKVAYFIIIINFAE